MKQYPVKTPQQLASVLRGFRKQQDLTQEKVGTKVGVPQKVVSKIELDPGRVSLSTIFKLLTALDLEIVVRPRGTSDRSTDW